MNLGQSWVDFSPLAKKRLRKTNLFYADIFSNFDLENLYAMIAGMTRQNHVLIFPEYPWK